MLSYYDYVGLTGDPDDLGVPTGEQPALPPITETSGVALDLIRPARDHEPLVAICHRCIQVIPAYWYAGWPAARPEMWVSNGGQVTEIQIAA